MKAMMKAACQAAGIINDWSLEGQHWLFALEPEVAAISLFDPSLNIGNWKMEQGKSFMVVDAGGGTIDITVFKKEQDVFIQMYKSSGGAAGGTFVDASFKKWVYTQCKDYLAVPMTEEAFYEEASHVPGGVLEDMMSEWEVLKSESRYDEDNLIGADSFVNLFLVKLLKDSKKLPSCLEDGCFRVSRAEILSFFEGPVSKTVEYMRQTIDALSGIHEIVLVGGFSMSQVLFDRIKESFPLYPLKRPLKAGSAVVSGAADFGVDPKVVHSRRTPLSYGVRTVIKWQKLNLKSPDGSPKTFGYRQLIGQNDSVTQDSVVEYTFGFQKEHLLQAAEVHLLCSTMTGGQCPALASDPSVRELGVMQIPKSYYMGADGQLAVKEITVRLHFGLTNLLWTVKVGKVVLPGTPVAWAKQTFANF